MNQMKIEFWLDYLNPICYYQHKIIECMIKSDHLSAFDITYRNYEMKPGFDPQKGDTLKDLLEYHYACSFETIKKKYPICLKDIKLVTVIDAHRLSHLAKKYQLGFQYHQLLFAAFYSEKLDISNHQVLLEIALEIGLDENEIVETLNSNLYLEQVMNNRDNAIVKGITEIPHLRIDGTVNLSGFVAKTELINQIEKAKLQNQKFRHCIGEHCTRKKAI
jgi:predicted DsbA family dithiol-disulfide isomerase